jgi:flagellar motor switch protein FliM
MECMMSGEVLSQEEVESLLSAMDGRGVGAAAASGVSGRSGPKVAPYDFKRPERVGKEQMRALQTMHEGFGRNFGAALSALLRTIVEVKLTSVDQLTYSEFVFSLENPTCFNLVNAPPLEGQLILDINLSLLYPIIDRLLGGNSDQSPTIRRPLTEIELRLVGRITDLFLAEMKHAWENVLELELSVDRVESNPQLVQIVPPNEVVVLISFEITIGDVRGMANLCITFNSIERISQQLTSNSWVAYGRRPPTPQSIQQISNQLAGSVVEVIVDLAETQIATSDLIGLQVGDIIATEKDVHLPLVLSVEGRPKFHAEAGVLKGRVAVQVKDAIGAKAPVKTTA